MLKVEDLKKMTVAKLQEFAKGVEGEDLVLVNQVITTKTEAGIAAEKAKADKIKERENAKAEREDAKKASDTAKEEKTVEREKKAAERKEKRDEAAKTKEERVIARQEEAKGKAEARALKLQERVTAKAERATKLEEQQKEKDEVNKAKEIAKIERAKATAVALKNFKKDTGPNKSQDVRDCLAQGMTNDEIIESTGFTRKFICDTVWRIERQIETQQTMLKAQEDAKVNKE